MGWAESADAQAWLPESGPNQTETDMSAWSQTDLATIGDADEIEVAPDRADHTAGSWVPIWVVRARNCRRRSRWRCQRRSNASANTPAGSANSIIGSVLAVCTSVTMVAALGSFTNSHCAPTVCAHGDTGVWVHR